MAAIGALVLFVIAWSIKEWFDDRRDEALANRLAKLNGPEEASVVVDMEVAEAKRIGDAQWKNRRHF